MSHKSGRTRRAGKAGVEPVDSAEPSLALDCDRPLASLRSMTDSSSNYSGHVEPGGPAISRDVRTARTTVEVRKFSVGGMDNNVYVLRDQDTDEAVIVDAADDAHRILAEVDGLDVVAVVTTHGHRDHWQALAQVAEATDADVYLHPADADMVPVEAHEPARDNLHIAFGGAEIELLHTPGHTPGSTCVLLRGAALNAAASNAHLFSGDTLFPGGPGNTFGDATAFDRIMRSLKERLFTLDDNTWVYPGHGDGTTIGTERPHLPEWERRGW